ncbi:MAG: class I SAM-dependent methyltransferase [Deltaproteobacteria bacterium]|nr:class I SAM-dependent methyltransferase [Deltaproteobacteria bacterium]
MSDNLSCPLCLASQTPKKEKERVYKTHHPLFASCQIVFCEACKSGWVSNPPDGKLLQEYYDIESNKVSSFFGFTVKPLLTLERCQSLARWRFILDAVRKAGRKDFLNKFSVCDIGAGYGCTLEVGRYQKFDFDFFAFEKSKTLRQHITALGGTVSGDLFETEEKKQFDLVWASHILEHYADPDIFIKEIKQLMKLEGLGFVEVPFLDCEYKTNLTEHLLFFTMDGLQKVLERNGLKILSLDSVGLSREKTKMIFEQYPKNRHSWHNKAKRALSSIFVRKNLATDLQNNAVFDEWGMEAYGGGDRCWIRAVFSKGCDA